MENKSYQKRSYNPLSAKNLSITAVLSAISAILEIFPIDLPFPLFSVLKFTPSGIPVAIGAIAYGPISGTIIAIVHVAVIAARGNIIGALNKFPAEFFTAIPAALVFWVFRKRIPKRSKNYFLTITITAFLMGVLGRVISMTLVNILLLPIFYGMSMEAVFAILPLIAIFNALQALVSLVPAVFLIVFFPPDLKPEWLSWGFEADT
ncbi:MAG: ECF transporter S component [Candidatus Ranarchaeia archaeon]|jgi:riboflavin transporter FmnP